MDSSAPSDPKVKQVLEASTSIIPASSGLKDTNAAFIKQHASSPPHLFSGLRARAFLDASSKPQNEKDLLAVADAPALTLQDVSEALALLKSWKSSEEMVSGFKSAVRKRWPDATLVKA